MDGHEIIISKGGAGKRFIPSNSVAEYKQLFKILMSSL